MKERVQKIISQWGIASRRQAEKMILAGRVRLNGQRVDLGQKADPKRDRLEVDGKLIKQRNRPEFVYLLLNKPLGVISTCHDPKGRKTAIDLLPARLRRGHGIHPVGRLDADSTGALLLSNDGAWTQRLTHPRHHLPKTYHVWVKGHPSESVLQLWREGIFLLGRKTLPADVEILTSRRDRALLKVVLYEGRNRQIRLVSQQLGHETLELHRTAIGPVQLQLPKEPMLPRGSVRALKKFEINGISRSTKIEHLETRQKTVKENLV
ncbi:rRNA pseudouridine synthase [Lusitaniella coriacea LEGE 07157]|uniref:Pseudouridine synthase n=1 Tax=Lusitaniella coriacea LEGE 07157 TaxID=945747 RepID=A0A8J7B8Y5_9CYAN|nr:pseudouridine synthase [Lusitaniella coriacea]MBE9115483.1 rRNA pseudouridine synthase [Lusitaniella coriacea LEGE 07157]